MTDPIAFLLAAAFAAQSPAQADLAPRDAFRVSCGERLCRVENRYAEFEVTRGDVRVQRILGHVPGDRALLRLTPASGGRGALAALVIGRTMTNQVGPLSRAPRISVAECRPREGDRSPTADPCLINLADLDVAVENARTRLTVARGRW
jgi:hypothetical protein